MSYLPADGRNAAPVANSPGDANFLRLYTRLLPFRMAVMNGVDRKKDSFPCLALRWSSSRKGVRDVSGACAAGGGRVGVVGVLYSIHRALVPAGAGTVRRARAVAGAADGHRRDPGRRSAGRG